MTPLKHPKQERFCLEYFKSGNAAAAATLAGYSVRSIRTIASRLLTNDNIIARIQELQQKAEDAKVMSVIERKKRLSEIARARISDFVKCENGISRINVGLESVNSAAIQEITSDEIQAGKGDSAIPIIVTKLKLHPPVQAINELNKMEGIYTDRIDINIHLIPVINNLVIQFVQIAREVNNITDPDERLKQLAIGMKNQLVKSFPELPKEDHE